MAEINIQNIKNLEWKNMKEEKFEWSKTCISNTCCREAEFYAHISITNPIFVGNNEERIKKMLDLSWIIFACGFHVDAFNYLLKKDAEYKKLNEAETKELFNKFVKAFSEAIGENEK